MKLKIATFNLENLFTRPSAMNTDTDAEGRQAIEDHAVANAIANKPAYSDADKAKLVELSKRYGWHLRNQPKTALVTMQKVRRNPFSQAGGTLHVAVDGRADWVGWFELRREDVRWEATYNTGRVIAETNADILVLVEIENRPTFHRFNDQVLKEKFDLHYTYFMVIDGNDERGIDVGVASRFPIRSVTSHVDDLIPGKTEKVFSRDCPEYEIELPGSQTLIVLPNHFKSKRNGNDQTSNDKRTAQAKRANEIAAARLAATPYVIIAGDLNDTPASPAIPHVLQNGFRDIIDHPDYPKSRPGTFNTGLASQKLDYLIASPMLWDKIATVGIERRGSYHPKTWTPFDTVTSATTEASDHHLLWAEFEL